MRLEIAGAQITTSVIEVIEDLQSNPALALKYVDLLVNLNDRVNHQIADITAGLSETVESELLERVYALQSIIKIITTLAAPPDVNLPENDEPVVQL